MNRRTHGWSIASVMVLLAAGCDDNSRLLDAGTDDLGVIDNDVPTVDLGTPEVGRADAGTDDAGAADTGTLDTGAVDAGAADVPTDRGTATDVSLDAGAIDVGLVDAGSDAGTIDRPDVVTADAGATDATPLDAGVTEAGVTDAGAADVGVDASSPRGTPVIDGVIGSDWPAGAIVVSNTIVSPWGGSLNALRSVRVAWDSTRLYLGLDGSVEAANAMLVFIDRDYVAGMTATGVTAISTLTDGVGSLDNSVSCNVTEAPTGFGADMVWGTRGMLSKTATVLNEAVGLREVGCTACRSDFRWTLGDNVVCTGGATPACEVSIEWTALYGGAPPPVPALGLFVRITNAQGTDLSNNQCLPQQGATDLPTVARQVLSFAPNL